MDWRERATITVEEAAVILGVGRSAAYMAANRGEIPTVRVGRRLICPTAKLRALLGENEESAPAANRDALEKLAGGDGHHEVYEQ